MKYTVIHSDGREAVYEGFTNHDIRSGIAPGATLAAAWFDGEPDYYITDGTDDALDELRRLYHDTWGEGRIQALQVFVAVAR